MTPEDLDLKFAEHPFARHLGIRTVSLAPGRAEVAVTLKPEHANFIGGVDGALIMSLIDHASAYAGSSVGKKVVGAQFSLNLIRGAAFEGDLTARAEVIHAGRKTVITEAEVSDDRGKTLARCSYVHIVVD